MLTVPAVSTPSLHNKEPILDWAPDFQEFVPETFGGPMVRPEYALSQPKLVSA
jgi:hypothetical protein